MKLKIFVFILLFTLIASIVPYVHAESAYVLPYPSSMPGSVWYKLDLLKEKVMQYWYYGDFGQFNYNLAQSDKYLVQAKTLFEYKQYLLAYDALLKSDMYYQKAWPSLLAAQKHGKDINQKTAILKGAVEKHIETLSKLKTEVPAVFNWTPEKTKPTYLNLENTINNSIKVRGEL